MHLPLPPGQPERRLHEASDVAGIRKRDNVVPGARDCSCAVCHVDVDGVGAHVAAEVRCAEVVGYLSDVERRPLEVGLAQGRDGREAEGVLGDAEIAT